MDVVAVAGLLLFAASLFGLVSVARATWSAIAGAPAVASTPTGNQIVKLAIDPPPLGGVRNAAGDVVDAFVPSTVKVRVGVPLQVVVVNYDDMPHSWSVIGLGLHEMIAAGSDSGPTTTSFTVTPAETGTYAWYCALPCDGWAMATNGYMRGSLEVTS